MAADRVFAFGITAASNDLVFMWRRVVALACLAMVGVVSPAAWGADRQFLPNPPDPVTAAQCAPSGSGRTVPAALRNLVECEHPANHVNTSRRWRVLQGFYRDRSYAPAWGDGRTPPAQSAALLQALQRASAHGLDPRDYVVGDMAARPDGDAFDNAAAAKLDVQLTWAFINYGLDVFRGRVARPAFHPVKDIDMEALLDWALTEHRVADALDQLTPRPAGYLRLQAALATYRAVEEKGGWPSVPAGPTLQRGNRGPRVTALRARLAASGDLDLSSEDSTHKTGAVFDAAVQAAVRRFQQRHGLAVNGAVNSSTLTALNVPVQQRIRELEINLERWRWLPTDLGYQYHLVNVPAYEQRVLQRAPAESGAPEQTLMQMRVIVGDREHPTKAFSAAVTQLVANPFWNVPPTIAADEMIPGFLNDRGYLSRRNIRVLRSNGGKREEVDPEKIDWSQPESAATRYTFRQDPGPQNALGRIKFIMPNPFGIYLHDTPKRHLFARSVRLASHGCIRLEHPMDLATHLLTYAGEEPAPLIEAVEQRTRRYVRLPQTVPIHLVYFTAWVDEGGVLQFRPDSYDENPAVDAGLRGAPDASPPPAPNQIRSVEARR